MRIAYQLHRSVVDDHLLEVNPRVELRHRLAASQEQSIAELHDVGLVDGCDLLAVVLDGVVESELGDPQRLLLCDDLQALHDAGNGLVFKRRVFALGLFADDDGVDSLMARLDAGKTGDMHHVRIQIQLVAELHVECLQLAGATEVGRRQDSLQANLVLLDGRHDVFQRRAQSGIDLREEERLEVDGNADGFEHFLH